MSGRAGPPDPLGNSQLLLRAGQGTNGMLNRASENRSLELLVEMWK